MFKLPKIPIPSVVPKLDLDLQSKFTLGIVSSTAASIIVWLSLVNLAGNFGGIMGGLLRTVLGRGAIFVPVIFVVIAVLLVRIQRREYSAEQLDGRFVWGTFFMVLTFCGYLNLFGGVRVGLPGESENWGGIFGYFAYPLVLGFFGSIGGFVLLFFSFLFGFFLFSKMTPFEFVDKLKKLPTNPELFWDFIPDILEFWRNQTTPPPAVVNGDQKIIEVAIPKTSHVKVPERKGLNDNVDEEYIGQVSLFSDKNVNIDTKPTEKQFVTDTGETILWKTPPFELLKDPFGKTDAGDIEANKLIIKSTLSDFNIDVEMRDVVIGPTVSQYSFKPASGVKLSSIDSLQSNLALELATSSIRMESPIAGKNLVGVELPNKVKSTVRLKTLIQTKEFKDYKGDLPLAIGMDVAGNNLVYSLAKMPHLLVAGSTGSGKSVWINNMLLCLMYTYSPQDLQLLLVDMKRVELKLYDGIGHLLAPVITDAEKAINALKWTVLEMERRYKLLEENGKRNIMDYNEFVRLKTPEGLGEMSYIVFVIDELGDLMMLAKNEVEPIIVRLTQMSRAVGIHLVLGTQRPDTQVVTGLIKANIPSRIAFAVASNIDSRVILDQVGAEKLLGQGDGLFMSPSTMKAVRFQGAFVEESEVNEVIKFIKKQGEGKDFLNNYNANVTEPPRAKLVVPGMRMAGEEGGFGDGAGTDDMFERAKEVCFTKGMASTSLLQTALGIGYPRARKYIQYMEDEGLVGPPNGSKPREVYPPEDWIV